MKMRDVSRISGFTLIEISISLIIVGIVMSAVFSMMSIYSKGKMHRRTEENLHNAEISLKAYLEMNGHYPCPASNLARRGQEGFGKSVESCISIDETKAESPFTDMKDGTLMSGGGNGYKARSGILPFRSLGIKDNDAIDGWGHLLQYAVTEKLTSYDTYNQKHGAIDVLAEDKESRVTPPASIQYVVFSTGADGKGGYSADGVSTGSCPAGLLESYNCDGDAVFMDTQSQFLAKNIHQQQTVSYDDMIVYQQYDPDAKLKGGLLFIYHGTCMNGFSEVDVDSSVIAGVDELWRDPANKAIEETGIRKLCISPRYSAKMMVQNQTDGSPRPCPTRWTEIGYQMSGNAGAGASYKVCAQ